MATAEVLRKEFMDFMDTIDKPYTVMDEDDNIVYLAFNGGQDTFIMVDFDEDDDNASTVHFTSMGFATVKQSSMAAAYVKLNEVNRDYRWAKFFLRDNEIWADCDAKVFPGTVGLECFEISVRLSTIIASVIDELAGIAVPDDEKMKMLSCIAAMKRAEM